MTVAVSVLDRFSLNGRVALVTGGASGLGAPTAVALAQAGASLVLTGRRVADLEACVSAIIADGGTASWVAADLSEDGSAERVVSTVLDRHGRLDTLVNNAGTLRARPALRESASGFRSGFDVNVFGTFAMSQACARVMTSGASIVNVGSYASETSVGLPLASYSASKAALIGLTRELAGEWGRDPGIRVNLVVPGIFAAGMGESARPDYLEDQIRRVPLGRLGDASELAHAIVFLASDASSYITGASLVVDGGRLVG